MSGQALADGHDALLRITGPATDDHTVPVEVLLHTLDGLQQAVYVLAAATEGQVVRERFRVSPDFRRRYQLLLGAAQPGSYALPLYVGREQLSFSAHGRSEEGVLSQLYHLLQAVQAGSPDELHAVVADSRLRDRALRLMRTLLPKPGDPWAIGFTVQHHPEVVVTAKAARTVEAWVSHDDAVDTIMTVTGQLIRIDFDQFKVVIRYAPRCRELECVYLPDIEDTIVENRREPIQVTGRCTLDADGHPVRLTDVTRIEPVDLSPMTFNLVEYGDRSLRLDPPLTIVPTLDGSEQLYMISDDELGLHLFAQTREQLAEELAEQLVFSWDADATEDPSRPTESAQRLRDTLRERLRALLPLPHYRRA
jgi:hypothetical protein